MQRVLHGYVENVGQFFGEEAARRDFDELLGGGHEGAEAGKPDVRMRPQAGTVEVCDLTKSVEAATMGVAGEVVERFEFAENGEIGGSAESGLEFGKGSDFVFEQVLAKSLGIEGERSHNDIDPNGAYQQSELYHNIGSRALMQKISRAPANGHSAKSPSDHGTGDSDLFTNIDEYLFLRQPLALGTSRAPAKEVPAQSTG